MTSFPLVPQKAHGTVTGQPTFVLRLINIARLTSPKTRHVVHQDAPRCPITGGLV